MEHFRDINLSHLIMLSCFFGNAQNSGVCVCIAQITSTAVIYEHINVDIAGHKLQLMHKHAQNCVLS